MLINLNGDELLEPKRMVYDLKAKMGDDDTKAVLNKIDIILMSQRPFHSVRTI